MNGCTGHCPHCGIELSVASNIPCKLCEGKRGELLDLVKSLPQCEIDEALHRLRSLSKTKKAIEKLRESINAPSDS